MPAKRTNTTTKRQRGKIKNSSSLKYAEINIVFLNIKRIIVSAGSGYPNRERNSSELSSPFPAFVNKHSSRNALVSLLCSFLSKCSNVYGIKYPLLSFMITPYMSSRSIRFFFGLFSNFLSISNHVSFHKSVSGSRVLCKEIRNFNIPAAIIFGFLAG